ncbi:hypothetical protein ACFS6H_20590 [Terrimonas rubra]|uniref:Uncharacterized protein n=1 Tax=Terrimonas rubra TaxID=1035890 RepID=A0ABW6ACF4_9BACT
MEYVIIIFLQLLSLLVSFISSDDTFFKKKEGKVKGLKFKGVLLSIVLMATAAFTCWQLYIANKKSNASEALLKNERNQSEQRVKSKVQEIFASLSNALDSQNLVFDTAKQKIYTNASQLQLTTDIIYNNLGEANKNVNDIQKNAESILNPITPMDVIIEYTIKVPTNYFTQFYPYINKPLPNQNTYFNEIQLNNLNTYQQSYIIFFDNIGFSKYSSYQNSLIGGPEWEKSFITIEQNLKEVSIQGSASISGDSIIISVWKIMKNVFIRNKDYANVQNYKSLLGWYLTFGYPQPPNEIKLTNISTLKFRTGHEKSQKIFVSSLPVNIQKEKINFFEKKITIKDFKHEYQGP